MIIQHEGKEIKGHERSWLIFMCPREPGNNVLLQHHAIDVEPDEDFTDTPDTHLLTWDEWLEKHDDYGLDVDGNKLED